MHGRAEAIEKYRSLAEQFGNLSKTLSSPARAANAMRSAELAESRYKLLGRPVVGPVVYLIGRSEDNTCICHMETLLDLYKAQRPDDQ